MNSDLHRYTMAVQGEREAFFDWMERVATINAEHNRDLSEEDIRTLIEQAREEVHRETPSANAPQSVGERIYENPS